MRKIMTLVLAGMTAMSLAGCAGTTTAPTEKATEAVTDTAADTKADETETEKEEAAAGNTALQGSITLAGSTSMEKYANALAEAFMEVYPDVTVQAEFTGSSAGVEGVLSGQCDIGNSSRALKDEEKTKGAVENIVAIDGIAVVTDAANTAADLTKEQLIGIYDGSINNWKDLGGAAMPIVVVGREAGSGTRGAFEEILDLEDKCAYANELDSTGAVMAKIASTPGAIGYVSLDVIDDSVKTLSLNGVEANEANIKSGDYFLSRPFVMATNGEISAQNDLVKALFDYVYSEDGAALTESVGLITVEK